MRKRLPPIAFLSFILLTVSAFVRISSGGIAGVTGSPGETTCANCHSGGGGTTTASISATPAFTGNQYNPGQTYTINVTVTNTSFTKFGFDAEVLTLSSTNSGTITTALSGVQFLNSGSRKNATHTAPKTGAGGTATFSFVWVAPASGTTKIFAAGNAVNGDGSTGGDKAGSASLILTPNATGIAENTSHTSHPLSVFPNPVSGDLRMQYTLLGDGKVKAALFDLSGREVEVLFSEYQQTGLHTISATIPEGTAAGLYMLKLSLNGNDYAQHLLISR